MFQQVVRDEPLVAAVVAEQFGDGEEENPPAMKPSSSFSLRHIATEDRQYFFTTSIELLEPSLRRAAVVLAAPHLLPDDRQIAIEPLEQISARHDTVAKEMSSHPIAGTVRVEGVAAIAVAKQMYK